MTKKKYLFLSLTFIFIVLAILSGCTTEDNRLARECAEIDSSCIYARTAGRYFEVFEDGHWQKLVIRGVNIGTSLPGRWYTEFPADRELYARWLNEIAAMNANAIRVYTLLDPSFYAVLAEYNSNPENETLWLFQEIWPDDEVPGLNFFDQAYADAYRQEIKLTIDALHGNADIPARPYRAYGNYSTDVTPFLLGLIIGRELEPDEVRATNEANLNLAPHSGNYILNAAGASPTEIWLAEMTDLAATYCDEEYNRQYPIGFVSWPTLDPLTHLTEWEADGTPGYNDREVVNPDIFITGPANSAGFFGAYHIYPNYPDLMNNEPAFAAFSDQEGVFRYKGYLNHFMEIHPEYPALVAEFGIATSLNTAHINPDGLNHGGLNETEQGEMIVRMMRSIIEEGYAGGIIFEWSDEWAKKTWNTEPFMVPWERQVLWHNAMCPEQNYGLVAVEPLIHPLGDLLKEWLSSTEQTAYQPVENKAAAFGKLEAIETAADEAYLYLAVTLNEDTLTEAKSIPWEQLGLAVGIDVGLPEAGENRLPYANLPELPGAVQFLLVFDSPVEAQLKAIPSYNRGLLKFDPQDSAEAQFEVISTLVNRERLTADGRLFPALYSNESKLAFGEFDPESGAYNSLAHWLVDENGRLVIRLPWMLLNVSDPSSGLIIRDSRTFNDLPLRDALATVSSQGFRFYALTYNKSDPLSEGDEKLPLDQVIDFLPRNSSSFVFPATAYHWDYWEEPSYQFRHKNSYLIIAEYFREIR